MSLGLLLCLVPFGDRALAQDHRLSLTGYLGTAAYGSLTEDLDPGAQLSNSGFYGGMIELWFGRFGARLHGGYANTSLDDDPDTGFEIAAGDVDFVARLRRPRPGQFFQPYGVLGLGAVRYDLGTDSQTVQGFAYESNPATRPTLVLGIGADLGGGPVAARIELMDIVGLSSPLSRDDGSAFGPVPHVVLILGLSLRVGTIDLPPEPERPQQPPINRVGPTQRPDTTAPPADTARADTARRDTIRRPPPRPRPPPVDTGVAVDTTAPDTTPPLPPEPPRDTARVAPPPPPIDTAGPPPDTTPAPVDTVRPPIRRPRPDTTGERLRPVVDSGPRRVPPPDTTRRGPPGRDSIRVPRPVPPPVDTGVAVDTTAPPPDTTGPRPPDPGPPTDTTPLPPPEPPDTGPPVDTTAPPPGTPTDTTDGGGVRGRLFTVRVTWSPDAMEQATAMLTLVDILEEAGVPMWPPVADPEEPVSHRRVAALRNAADARILGNHIAETYGLEWEWVHIDRDEDVPAEAVEASTAFVDALRAEGTGPGRPGGPPD